MQLHPGVTAALRRLGADELGIARLMSEGELSSPQRYHNVTLVNLRITGTGVSYRPSLDEYVYRKPENYLTPDFLARCNGLSVIWKHPRKSLLNSQEFGDRVIGSVMLPYIKGDEVWAIAKVYEDDAITLLQSEQLSTSPAVLLSKNQTIIGPNGEKVLIEGPATLLDHIAICEHGVWDKGGDPTGVEQSDLEIRGDSVMAEEANKEMEKADAARADAEKRMDEQLDQILKGIDSLRSDMAGCNSRMDAFEEKERKDAEEREKEERKDGDEEPEDTKAKRLAADKARKDEEDEKVKKDAEEKERADSVSNLAKMVKDQAETIKSLTALVRQPIADTDRAALSQVQARADEVQIQLGKRAPQPLVGESPVAYRRRMADDLKQYSDRFKDERLDSLPDSLFAKLEDQIYADAATYARNPNDLKSGQMREITKRTPSGHIVTEFQGSGAHFVQQFSRTARRVKSFRTGNAF